MAKAELALDIMREAGVLACMLFFVISGALLMLSYANDGDALPVFGGLGAMLVGALLLRTPAGAGRRARPRQGLLARLRGQGEEQALDEDLHGLDGEPVVYAYEESMLRPRR